MRNPKVCILGASGGVGTIAVQIAKAANAEVTATSSKNAMQMVEQLGADRVVDYRSPNVEEEFRGHYYDIILDCAGLGSGYATDMPWKYHKYISLVPPLLNDTDTNGLIPGAIVSVVKLLYQNAHSVLSRKGFVQWGLFQADRKGIEYLTKITQHNQLKPVVDSVFHFEETDKAIQKMAAGHLRGKIIVKVK